MIAEYAIKETNTAETVITDVLLLHCVFKQVAKMEDRNILHKFSYMYIYTFPLFAWPAT
jgi:hypothetical protein